jgi:hypothetical protein
VEAAKWFAQMGIALASLGTKLCTAPLHPVYKIKPRGQSNQFETFFTSSCTLNVQDSQEEKAIHLMFFNAGCTPIYKIYLVKTTKQ